MGAHREEGANLCVQSLVSPEKASAPQNRVSLMGEPCTAPLRKGKLRPALWVSLPLPCGSYHPLMGHHLWGALLSGAVA